MYCTYCNHPNPEGNKFCESCGKPLENRSKEIKFKKCPYCAEEIQDEAKVCRYCGRGLENSTELKFAISPETNKKVQQLDKAVGEHMAMGWILLSKTDYAVQMQYPKKFDWAIFLSTVALVPLTIGSLFFLPFVYLIYWSLIQKPKMIVITVNDNLQVLVNGALMTGATSTGMTYWGLVSKFSLWGLLTKKVTPGMSPEEMANIKKYNNKLVMYIIVAVIGICFICTLLGVLPSIVQNLNNYGASSDNGFSSASGASPTAYIPDNLASTSKTLTGTWEGDWTSPSGYLYACEIVLEVSGTNSIDGQITWTLKKSPTSSEQSKIGLTAIEYISGTYDPQTRLAVFNGYKSDDPNTIIGLDNYKLFLSVDSNTLSGETANNGDWKGILTAIRKP